MKEQCERGVCHGEPVIRGNVGRSINPTAPAGSFGHDFSRVPAATNTTGKLGGPMDEDAAPIAITGNGGPKPKPGTPAKDDKKPAANAAPPKLSHAKVSGPTAYDCGSFSWVVQWKLDRKTTKGGWVVQKVAYSPSVKTCDDKEFTPSEKAGLDPSWYPMWEAWPIDKDQDVTKYASDNADVNDDTYGCKPMNDTKGSQKITGTAEFYEGLTLPADFKVTKKAPTYILPTTKSAPKLAGGTGADDHSISMKWNCCKDSKSKKTEFS